MEKFAIGISSQKSTGENAFGMVDGVGAIGGWLGVPIHGFSPWKIVGERETKELRRAVSLAIR